MSATWALTYLEGESADKKLFDAVVDAFQQKLEGKLYGLAYPTRAEYKSVQLGSPIVEWFTEEKRARLITDSLFLERFSTGVLLYPSKNGLITLADNVINLEVYEAGRLGRQELELRIQKGPDEIGEMLFHYMHFLEYLTGKLNCDAAHLMFDRNPAGRATAVHFYSFGTQVDDYFYENIEAIGTQIIELPLNPEQLNQALRGRFAFLSKQPIVQEAEDETYFTYFDAEHIASHGSTTEISKSGLYVPFWNNEMLPVGAVYCLKRPLPNYFLKRYE